MGTSRGIFGLNSQPVNFSSLGNHTAPSFITSLKDSNKIPSLSWSYTAGAKYRESLTNMPQYLGNCNTDSKACA